MYAAQRATQLAKTITMACSVQKQPTQPQHSTTTAAVTSTTVTTPPTMAVTALISANNTNNISNQMTSGAGSNSGSNSSMSGAGGGVSILAAAISDATTKPLTPKPRGSLPNDAHQPPQVEFHWPPKPVSTHTSNLRLNMMNQNPKDLHTARLMIEELRTKVRYQAEHIMKWRKTYALQIQQHYRYQKEKSDQMNTLTSQLLLLESRLKRKQKQIGSLLSHRELTIQRQQKIIDTLSSRLSDHGLETIEANFTTELDSLNDSDSAVVLEDIDSDSSHIPFGARRRSSGGGSGFGSNAGQCGSDGITIVRSISDAIETNLNKYSGVRRNNCFLRRPEILETVYSVEEDPEPTSDVAEKRDKFRTRSEKALSSSSTEGQIDSNSSHAPTHEPTIHSPAAPLAHPTHTERTKENLRTTPASPQRQLSISQPLESPTTDGYTAYSVKVPQLRTTAATPTTEKPCGLAGADVDGSSPPAVKSQVTNYNRVMSNHRSVTKPKDVKYKRINKAKSKSLEELRGRLKNLVERGGSTGAGLDAPGGGAPYPHGVMPQTAQSYA
ncbi:uncharacterized protein LOC101455070 [Ceratitis capitata]|uniref:Uncharacterized protein n=1 Tax=Ceratitis capitata TaxID=7213 RepID=W8BXW3_CERCA|nr:uncharacterized protein LOC101455070 [Ceratitis capitata]XP_023158599.1 uncharacterized protein LOC101455070 [Ceratitis capitata]XP_023158600.1 uncharacterized protein LOC101455070 [Ceratitis capitata]XP_023158601.1 uncharacterized protein LOC101455070 [Ceratitis capitata]